LILVADGSTGLLVVTTPCTTEVSGDSGPKETHNLALLEVDDTPDASRALSALHLRVFGDNTPTALLTSVAF